MDLLELDEIYWRQRSRAIWLKEGNKNTWFFHKKALAKQKVNTLKKIRNDSGDWVLGKEGVNHILEDYFHTIFTSSNPINNLNIFNMVCGKVPTHATEVMSEPFHATEIQNALFVMHPIKAPGVDGLLPLFFPKHWSFMEKDVIQTTLNILNHGHDLTSINQTLLCLISKQKNPKDPKTLNQ
ncbi:hypothetical protein VNO77_20416 [Canavalia gladiata]|uniref:Reverse transcriptase n=1 Tax=Canavalia gladiata TaxID=3824 RepID=A0AAN9LPG2_CANGL